MTHSEYRRYGYVSRLSSLTCGSGSVDSAINTNNALTQQQLSLAQSENATSQANQATALQLEQPLIAKETALASGDKNAALSAAMPTISQISSGYAGAKESIFNTVAPGAARDTALANLQTQAAVQPATAMASAVDQAPSVLANVGQGIGAFSIQQLGAALSGYSGASTTNQTSLQSATQQQAAKLGVAGDLLGAAGTAAGGGAFGKLSDIRLKTNIVPLAGVLEALAEIQPAAFQYRHSGRSAIGVMAQEVQPFFPQMVLVGQNEMLQVDYGMLAAVAIQAAKELRVLVDVLTTRIESLERQSNVGRGEA